MSLLESFANEAERLSVSIPANRYPMEKLQAIVQSYDFISVPGEDEYLRPAFVSAQAAFELAVAHELKEGGIHVIGVIHTPKLVKPLTVWPNATGEGIHESIWNDPARLDTVRIRAQEALPAFMKAGGLLIAAATSTEMNQQESLTFSSHQDEHRGSLQIHKLQALPVDMIGASYFIENEPNGISFAYIRAQQSDTVGIGTWTFGLGNPDNNSKLKVEKDRTVEFLAKNAITLG